MLNEVKESIMNAYEIKTGMARDKISKLMDAETWMDAHKAMELGFVDGILERNAAETEDAGTPQVSMMYSKVAVTNSLLDKVAAKCRIDKPVEPEKNPETDSVGRKVSDLMDRLELMKY